MSRPTNFFSPGHPIPKPEVAKTELEQPCPECEGEDPSCAYDKPASSSEFDEAGAEAKGKQVEEQAFAYFKTTVLKTNNPTINPKPSYEYFCEGARWQHARDAEEIARLNEKLDAYIASRDAHKELSTEALVQHKKLTEENQRLKAEMEKRSVEAHDYAATLITRSKECVARGHRIEKLTAALKFYAEDRLYVNVGCRADLYDDKGARARQALASEPGGEM